MTDPWNVMLHELAKDYDKLCDLMNDVPKISATLEKMAFSCSVRIHEDWDKTPSEEYYQYYTASDEALEEKLLWATEQLSTWPNVKRLGFDRWSFSKKRDAEKFITLFNLTWAQ